MLSKVPRGIHVLSLQNIQTFISYFKCIKTPYANSPKTESKAINQYYRKSIQSILHN